MKSLGNCSVGGRSSLWRLFFFMFSNSCSIYLVILIFLAEVHFAVGYQCCCCCFLVTGMQKRTSTIFPTSAPMQTTLAMMKQKMSQEFSSVQQIYSVLCTVVLFLLSGNFLLIWASTSLRSGDLNLESMPSICSSGKIVPCIEGWFDKMVQVHLVQHSTSSIASQTFPENSQLGCRQQLSSCHFTVFNIQHAMPSDDTYQHARLC